MIKQRLVEIAEGDGLRAGLAARVLPAIEDPSDDIYVTSFCRDGDLLSQWRGYGAFGRGYSLGFDFGLNCAPPIQMAWLIEVLYDERLLVDAIDKILDVFCEHINTSSSTHVLEDFNQLFLQSLNLLWFSFKHPSYSAEQEVRFLTNRASSEQARKNDSDRYGKVHYRSLRGEVTPYLNIGMSFPDEEKKILPLTKVVVGPGLQFDRNKSSIEQMLFDHGYDNVEVVPSKVPFSP